MLCAFVSHAFCEHFCNYAWLGALLPVYRHLFWPSPPILCMYFALFLCTLLNGKLLFSIVLIIIHTLPHITLLFIHHHTSSPVTSPTSSSISYHTIYFITPTPTHYIPNHWRSQQLTVKTFGLIIFLWLNYQHKMSFYSCIYVLSNTVMLNIINIIFLG